MLYLISRGVGKGGMATALRIKRAVAILCERPLFLGGGLGRIVFCVVFLDVNYSHKLCPFFAFVCSKQKVVLRAYFSDDFYRFRIIAKAVSLKQKSTPTSQGLSPQKLKEEERDCST